MSDAKCRSCGAASPGTYVCSFCGVLANAGAPAEEQRRALDEFHGILEKADDDKRKDLFKTGFIPDHKAVLIEAGVRTVPFIEFAGAGDEAALRLEAIALKLKLLPEDPETAKAVAAFEARVNRHRSFNHGFGWGCGLVGLAVLVLIVWGALKLFRVV